MIPLIMVLIRISIMIHDVEHCFQCAHFLFAVVVDETESYFVVLVVVKFTI